MKLNKHEFILNNYKIIIENKNNGTVKTGINIWLIINGIRPAYRLDSYAIQSKKKMDELLSELKKSMNLKENLLTQCLIQL